MRVDYSKFKGLIFWKKVVENVKEFSGSSPPSFFVGRKNYPNVFVGILSSFQNIENAEILDYPEKWYSKRLSIEKIFELRCKLIYARSLMNIKEKNKRLIETFKEIVPSRKKVDVEIELRKPPKFRFLLNNYFQPIGNPAPILRIKLNENPKIESFIEKKINDKDLKAFDCVVDLYEKGVEISRIQKIFSAGLLGLENEKKLVPTRWSITAIDSIISNYLLKKIKYFKPLEKIMVFKTSYIGNHFNVIFLPDYYKFEIFEWKTSEKIVYNDYENFFGLKSYAENTGGAFYAAKLACLEYLRKIKRQASIIVLREESDEYYLPVGIWHLRESLRNCFNSKKFEIFDDINDMINKVNSRLKSNIDWAKLSKVLRFYKNQKRLTIKSG